MIIGKTLHLQGQNRHYRVSTHSKHYKAALATLQFLSQRSSIDIGACGHQLFAIPSSLELFRDSTLHLTAQ